MSAMGRSISSLKIKLTTNAESWLLDGYPCLIETRQRHILSLFKGKRMMSAVNVIPGLALLTHHLNNIPINHSKGDPKATSRVGFTNSSAVIAESKQNVSLVERKLLSKQPVWAWGVGRHHDGIVAVESVDCSSVVNKQDHFLEVWHGAEEVTS